MKSYSALSPLFSSITFEAILAYFPYSMGQLPHDLARFDALKIVLY